MARWFSRRSLLEAIITGTAILSLSPWITVVVQAPQPRPSPNAPATQNVPAGLGGSDVTRRQNGAPNRMVNRDQVVAAVEQLYKLVS